eukprot:TRINITY_DN963_c1_g1_i2.p1 TRINITY_DN963_c1_g1~~TRINITY_DN963_c1_g1_i2.p1  ORF type:complete len:302 (+),score=54.71 TRINITY_DN963_c1_g1_i2:209-1114(+)
MKHLNLEGSPFQIGLNHGTQLSTEIKHTINFYKQLFGIPDEDILSMASHFKNVIELFNPFYIEEMEGIAQGAQVELLWIVAINARTEIYNNIVQGKSGVTECTAFYFSESSVLFQTWDWAKELEKLMVCVRIQKDDGHVILQLIEPGMLGKIGLNSAGLGVTLNFLDAGKIMNGLPIHIVLRHFLDSTSIEEGIESLGDYELDKTSNIIFADDQGAYVNLEFAGESVFKSSGERYFTHTNHYLGDESLNISAGPSTYHRYDRALVLLSETQEQSISRYLLFSILHQRQRNAQRYSIQIPHL